MEKLFEKSIISENSFMCKQKKPSKLLTLEKSI